jgi:RHS repeat-associated protein
LNQVTASENGSFNASGHYTGATATTGDSGSPIASSSIAYYNGTDPWTMVVTDEASKVHRYSLDAYGRTNQVVEVFSGSALTTTYGYNLAGDLTNVTDNAANQIQYAYNNMGEMVAMADPDMGVWQYQRDVAGRLRAQIDGDGNTVNFDYTDPLGRLVTRQVYDFTDAHVLGVTNVYDSSDDANFTVYAEQLYKTIDSQGYVKNSYDVRGRTLKTARYLSKNGNTYTNQYLYDDLNRVTQMIYPNGGPTVTNIYDTGANLSKVQQVGGSGTVYYSASGFNALDQLTGISFGNGAATANTYYANSHRLQSVVTSKGGNLQSLSYTYDQVSDLLGVTDGVYTGTASASIGGVAYDDLHRLLSLIRNGQTVTFGYSSIGNITTNGENGTAAYGYGTRLPHAVKSANGTNYAYDQNGSMLTRGNQELVYDPENRLVMVVMSNSTVTFGYDAGGTRLWKQGALTNSLQVWIDGNYEEKDGRVLYHISANGREVCTFDSTGTNVFEYYHPDHLHSTAIETDTNGNRIQHYEYSIYGQSRFTESTTAFPVSRRYTSQVLDEETGLYYYGARYYDPQLGRFVQPDTIIPNEFDPQNYDRYAYCLNNPLKYVDSSGHFVFLAPLIYGAVSAGIGYAAIHIYGSSAIARSDIQTAANLDRMVQAHDFANYNDFLVTQGRTVTAGATSEQVQAAQELGKAGAESVMMANTTIVPELKLEFGIIRGEVPKGGTYKLEEPQTGAVKRTGRTKDLKRRQLEHARGEATKDLDFRVDKRTDDYDTQRGQEQVIYDQHPEAKAENGGLNMNQPISPTNPNKEDYMNAAAAEYPQ